MISFPLPSFIPLQDHFHQLPSLQQQYSIAYSSFLDILVPKYPPTNVTGHNTSSTTLHLSWSPVPIEDTYKELRGYVVYVIESSTTVIVKNITTDASTHEVLIDELKKFRTYTLYIRALSIDVGLRSITMNLTTAEDG